MFCRFCGKTLEDTATFCRFCGKRLDGTSPVKIPRKTEISKAQKISKLSEITKMTNATLSSKHRRLITSACVLVIALCLMGIIQNNNRYEWDYEENSYFANLAESGGSSNGNNVAEKSESIDFGSNTTESGNQQEVSQSETSSNSGSGTYSVTSRIDGSTLSVKPGQCATLYKHAKYAEGDGRASLQLPEMEAYSQGVFLRTNCNVDSDGHYKYSYVAKNCTRDKCLDIMKKYHDLLADYSVNVTLETDYKEFTSYSEWYGGDYVGGASITSNSVTSYRENFDLTFFFDASLGYTYTITCPEEIAFIDFGDRCDGTKDSNSAADKVFQYTSSFSSEMTDNGEDAYILGGWNPDTKGDKVKFVLNPDMLEEGEEFGLDYFVNPSDNACSFAFTVYGTETTDFWISYREGKERFKDASVKILEKSDAVTAISFYICYRNRVGDDCILEGIFAVQTGDPYYVEGAGSGQDDSGGLGTIGMRCTHCGGDGDAEDFCSRCSGSGYIDCRDCFNGKENCTRCGGDGDVYDALNGRETDCFSCTGGKVRCSTCNGNGSIRCNQCSGGKKTKNCTLCGGDGEL